jgi:broad specificity phosphatase PhoE
MTTFYLIRHALCDAVGRRIAGRAAGHALNAAGRAQASELPDRLPVDRLDAIYSSPLERAIETALPLANRSQLPVTERDDLNEIDFGAWTGKSLRELDEMPQWRRWNNERSRARVPGGESMLEVQTRIVQALTEIRDEHPTSDCAVISHCDVIRAALVFYLGIALDDMLAFDLRPASVSVVRLTDAAIMVEAVDRL